MKEPLIIPSFRAKRSGDPESSVRDSTHCWILADAGMTRAEILQKISLTLISVSYERKWDDPL
jgi:hypothetical protein